MRYAIHMMLLLASVCIHAASEISIKMEPVAIDLHDKARLQRGAKMYMNYCSGCHSLKFMRYNRMAEDLGLTTFDGQVLQDLLYNNLIFTSAKIHDPIEIAMPKEDSRQWFGIVPPDLSLTAREKGSRWIYNYLKSFYRDESRPFGANNLLIPGVAMPNVLASLEGDVVLRKNTQSDAQDLILLREGEMNQHQFDSTLQDIVNFLTYVSEPVALKRYRMGVWVLGYLAIFAFIAWLLKKSYWKRLK